MKNEARVGVVVVMAIALMVVGYIYLRNLGLSADKYYMRLVGATIITPGNEVRLQGVKIGQITDVTLNAVQKPIITVSIKRTSAQIQLLKSYEYSVQSSALIGENYVDIRGPFQASAPAYEPNNPENVIPVRAANLITGVTDQAEVLMKDLRGTVSRLNTTLDTVNKGVLSPNNQVRLARALEGVAKLTERAGQGFGPNGVRLGLGDPGAQRNLNETMQNAARASQQVNDAAGDLRAMAGDLRGMVGENKGQVRGLLTNLNKTAEQIGGLADSVSFLVKNGGLRENLNATLTAARQTAENVRDLTGSLKGTTSDEKGDLKATLAAARRSAENVEAATDALKALTDADTQKNLRSAITALSATAGSLRDTADALKTTLADDESKKQLKSTIATINQATTSLAETSANLKEASAGFKNVLGDPKVQADLKALPGSLRASADELQKTLATTRGTAESFKNLADNVSGILPRRRRPAATPQTGNGTTPANTKASTQPGKNFPSGVSFTYRNLSNFGGKARVGSDVTGNNYGDLGFDATLFGGPLRMGLSNIGDGTDITAQTGRYFGPSVALRYGVYRSELGAGVELRKGRFFAEGNAWDLNNGSYNALAGVKITPKIEAFVGHENIRGVRANELGVRLRP